MLDCNISVGQFTREYPTDNRGVLASHSPVQGLSLTKLGVFFQEKDMLCLFFSDTYAETEAGRLKIGLAGLLRNRPESTGAGNSKGLLKWQGRLNCTYRYSQFGTLY